MSIDDQRRQMRAAEAQRRSEIARHQGAIEGIMSRTAQLLRQSISNSSGARTYKVTEYRRPEANRASAGVAVHARGREVAVWSFWMHSSGPGSSVHLTMGWTNEWAHVSIIDSPEGYIQKAIQDAEGALAADLETKSARSGGALAIVLLVAPLALIADAFR